MSTHNPFSEEKSWRQIRDNFSRACYMPESHVGMFMSDEDYRKWEDAREARFNGIIGPLLEKMGWIRYGETLHRDETITPTREFDKDAINAAIDGIDYSDIDAELADLRVPEDYPISDDERRRIGEPGLGAAATYRIDGHTINRDAEPYRTTHMKEAVYYYLALCISTNPKPSTWWISENRDDEWHPVGTTTWAKILQEAQAGTLQIVRGPIATGHPRVSYRVFDLNASEDQRENQINANLPVQPLPPQAAYGPDYWNQPRHRSH